ncbi:MAG: phosphatidylserine decarboxylase [Burkholderiaceae bacterium]|nr:phosphatidylserine decarboxylase [Burkholderiaceae bacterium]
MTTQQLIDMVEHNSEMKALLARSIARAGEVNPDRKTNPAQTLSEFYDFVERAITSMPWDVLEDQAASGLYEKIDQGLGYIYFISDIPLKELEGRGYYNNSIQYVEPYRSWLISYAKAWGSFLDSEVSWNDEYYKKVYEDKRFGLSEGWYENPSNWKTFNHFFSRNLRDASVRPIAAPEDSAIVASPADSKPQGVWEIDADSRIVRREGVSIKSRAFHSIPDLIGPDSAYRHAFAGGTLTHTFLDIHDYHHYHFPVGGTVKEMRIILSDDAVGGLLTWDAQCEKYVLQATGYGWQSIETRGCMVLVTGDFGLVALLPVGMSQISSVNYEPGLKVGDRVKKGDKLGYFLFGGSDFVLLFQKGVDFSLTAPASGDGYRHILMGEEYGRLSRGKTR